MEFNKILQGDALEVLKTLPDECIDCIITSPPYWDLRNYGTPVWEGGNKTCDHILNPKATKKFGNESFNGKRPSREQTKEADYYFKTVCKKCGVIRIDNQLGQEKDVEEFITRLCDIFDEVRRVLKKEGTCWINMGDTLKKKSLHMVPERFAIEMIRRGWILRNQIIWQKPNCMPDSAEDRFTVDFEKVFFFVKSQKYYFITPREPHLESSIRRACRAKSSKLDNKEYSVNYSQEYLGYENFKDKFDNGELRAVHPEGRKKRTVWNIPTKGYPGAHFATYPIELLEIPIKSGCPERVCKSCKKAYEVKRRLISLIDHWDDNYWWSFLLGESHSNERFKKAFGIMKKWMVQHKNFNYEEFYESYKLSKKGNWGNGDLSKGYQKLFDDKHLPFPKPESRMPSKVIGLVQACKCKNAGWTGGVILDPFGGSGTTGVAALRYARQYLLIELYKEYIELAQDRLRKEDRISLNDFNILESREVQDVK